MPISRAPRTTVPQVPFQEKIAENGGYSTSPWQEFFRSIFERLMPLGIEQSFDMTPDLVKPELVPTPAKDIVGLKFDFTNEQSAVIEFVIQRVTKESTTGAADGQEIVSVGECAVLYRPRLKQWVLTESAPRGVPLNLRLNNNQAVATDLVGLNLDEPYKITKTVKFSIRRKTSPANDLLESGQFIVAFNRTTNQWSGQFPSSHVPNNSGFTLSVNAFGQVQYTSSNLAGADHIAEAHFEILPWSRVDGVWLSITPQGQVQYKADAMTGTRDIDKITWRVRTLKAKIAKSQGVWV